MLCYEVHRNGVKLCTAGVGDFGVLSAIVTWVSHHQEKLARWAAEGKPDTEAVRLELTVGGLGRDESDAPEHLRWAECDLATGDEIRIRIVEVPEADPPQRRHQDDPATVEEQ